MLTEWTLSIAFVGRTGTSTDTKAYVNLAFGTDGLAVQRNLLTLESNGM